MKTFLITSIALSLAIYGCTSQNVSIDLTPPVAPRGVESFAGDNFVEVFWTENTERDLAGYNIYVAFNRGGNFRLIGNTRAPHFIDRGVANGQTYYYAVTAYDFDGNESDLSVDAIGATPRPEGYSVPLLEYRSSPGSAGYDFSTFSIGPYDDKYTDIFYEYSNGVAYMDVWDDSDIQDMGYTISLDEIRFAPEAGWSPTKDVRLIVGHTYVVWTWDNRFAKFRIVSLSPQRAVFDWAYQLMEGNPFLKRNTQTSADRGSLSRVHSLPH